MIVYSPIDGLPLPNTETLRPRSCFIMTRLGDPIPNGVIAIRESLTSVCSSFNYSVIDAHAQINGRDILLKIWKLIAAIPLSIAIIHKDIPNETLANIYYEIGIAQALGKETLLIKCPDSKVPSDLIRSEHIIYDDHFTDKFQQFMEYISQTAAQHEIMGDTLENNPILALDYYRRAFLLCGDEGLKNKARSLLEGAGLENRAKNSVELSIASFSDE